MIQMAPGDTTVGSTPYRDVRGLLCRRDYCHGDAERFGLCAKHLKQIKDKKRRLRAKDDKAMTDELFQAYKAKVSELLKAKVPFGGHQRQAFETVVGAEINRLQTRCALLQSPLGEGIRAGYFDPAKCSPSWLLEANREIAIFAGMPPKNS
jgi:hypothetical protein